MSYELSALIAAKTIQYKNLHPKEAWNRAVQVEFPDSESGQDKGCPRNTFLSLCEMGRIKYVAEGNYTTSEDNKRYALKAINILRDSQKDFKPLELWKEVLKTEANCNKQHNCQMNVVIALVNEKLIEL